MQAEKVSLDKLSQCGRAVEVVWFSRKDQKQRVPDKGSNSDAGPGLRVPLSSSGAGSRFCGIVSLASAASAFFARERSSSGLPPPVSASDPGASARSSSPGCLISSCFWGNERLRLWSGPFRSLVIACGAVKVCGSA